MKCPYCGRDNDEQAKTCFRCKAALSKEQKTEETSLKVTKRKKESEHNGT